MTATDKVDAKSIPTVKIGGLPTIAATRAELASIMVHDCLMARESGDAWIPKTVFSSNGQGVALSGQSLEFSETMKMADIIHADGMSVVIASRVTRHPLPERIATTDFFHDAAIAAQEAGLKFFILGAKEEQNQAAVAAIKKKYPRLKIVGRRNGYFTPDQDQSVCEEIRRSGADVLWVALGKPRQEYWSIRNRENLKGIAWIKTCGGLYSFLAGDSPRAPQWMQKLCLEWFYRTIKEPKRLGWRYLTTNPYSIYKLIKDTDWKR